VHQTCEKADAALGIQSVYCMMQVCLLFCVGSCTSPRNDFSWGLFALVYCQINTTVGVNVTFDVSSQYVVGGSSQNASMSFITQPEVTPAYLKNLYNIPTGAVVRCRSVLAVSPPAHHDFGASPDQVKPWLCASCRRVHEAGAVQPPQPSLALCAAAQSSLAWLTFASSIAVLLPV